MVPQSAPPEEAVPLVDQATVFQSPFLPPKNIPVRDCFFPAALRSRAWGRKTLEKMFFLLFVKMCHLIIK